MIIDIENYNINIVKNDIFKTVGIIEHDIIECINSYYHNVMIEKDTLDIVICNVINYLILFDKINKDKDTNLKTIVEWLLKILNEKNIKLKNNDKFTTDFINLFSKFIIYD